VVLPADLIRCVTIAEAVISQALQILTLSEVEEPGP